MTLTVAIKSFSKIRGEEPTIVSVPPKIAQNPMGINRRLIGISVRADIRLTTGRNRAAAPTFCIKLEIRPTTPETIGMMRFSVRPPYLTMLTAIADIRPVLSSPAPIIMTAMMDMTALEANPSNRCSISARFWKVGNALRMPSVTIMNMAARSTRTISDAKRKTVKPSRQRTAIMSWVRMTACMGGAFLGGGLGGYSGLLGGMQGGIGKWLKIKDHRTIHRIVLWSLRVQD